MAEYGVKINSNIPVGTTSARRVQKSKSKAGAKFATEIREEADLSAQTPVSGSAALAPVDALIALQEVGDTPYRRSPAIIRGENLLRLLDDLRMGLLAGRIPIGQLDSLLSAVRSQRAAIEEPRLNTVLEEIELRASVELAKLGRAPI